MIHSLRARLLSIVALFLFLSIPALSQSPPENSQLIYAIASHKSIPQNQLDDFVVDYMLARDGSLRVSLFSEKAEGTALKGWTLKRQGNTPTAFDWDFKLKGSLIEPGHYILRFTSMGRIEESIDASFDITAPQAALPLQLSAPGDFLPASSDTAAVWQALMAPMPIADVGDLSHEPLYDQPGGKQIGHVHGQTAGLVLLALQEDGYARVGAFATEDGSYIEGYIRQNRLAMISPHPDWGLVIDKVNQSMQVYQADPSSPDGARLVGTLSISTGLMEKSKTFQETRAGAFITQKRIKSFTTDGYRYDFAIRIDGGNLIHEVGHKRSGSSKDFSDQLPQLGSKASHGCVRVNPVAGDSGLDARWLWLNLPRNTKVLVLDDPQVRMQRLTELGDIPPLASAAQPGEEAPALINLPFTVIDEPLFSPEDAAPVAVQTVLASVPTAPAAKTRLTMTFTGDSILGSEEKSRKKPESFHSFIDRHGYGWPYSGLLELLSQDDLSIINLEGVLKDDTRGRQEGRLHWFRGPTDFVNILPAGSIELAGLANNHMRDYGLAGHNSTRKALSDAGIPYFGYGDTYIHEHQGLKIGFGGIRETIWRQKPQLPGEEIAALREAGCDYIIYTIHAGKEYSRTHNELQTKMAHAIIDAGADIIIGMHPHVVQGIEQYKDGLIVYSLGNFSFGGNLKLTEFDGLALQVILDFDGRALRQTTLKLIPVLTTGTKPANDFRPIPASGEDKDRILQLVQNDSPDLRIQETMIFR